jgi:hypothetical protein
MTNEKEDVRHALTVPPMTWAAEDEARCLRDIGDDAGYCIGAEFGALRAALAAEREKCARLRAPRLAPVQGERGVPFPGRVPWELSARAWGQYAALGHGGQSHERLCERGGFGVYEFVHLLHGRNPYRTAAVPSAEEIAAVRDECEGRTALHAQVTALTVDLTSLRAEHEALRGAAEKLLAVDFDDGGFDWCAACKEHPSRGHRTNCPLLALRVALGNGGG